MSGLNQLTDDRENLPIYQFLDDLGTGLGVKDMIGDYSSTPQIFKIQPAAGKIYKIFRTVIDIEDTGSFDTNSYGNGTVLTNGIVLRKQDNSGTIISYTDGLPVKTNTQWLRFSHDGNHENFGSGPEHFNVRWIFVNPVILRGDNNERLECYLNDDFTHLESHYMQVQGEILNEYQ